MRDIWNGKMYTHFSEAALAGWAQNTAFLPFMTRLPKVQAASFGSAARKELCKRTRRSGGRYVEIFRRLNVMARKQAARNTRSPNRPLDLP